MAKTGGAKENYTPRALVDVGDVAEAHLRAAKIEQIDNLRIPLVQQVQRMCHLGQLLFLVVMKKFLMLENIKYPVH